jgi:hypothetical protein
MTTRAHFILVPKHRDDGNVMSFRCNFNCLTNRRLNFKNDNVRGHGDYIMRARSIAAVAIFVLVPCLGMAGPGSLHKACRNDVKALCGSVQPGEGRIRNCMREHRTQLSNACKLAIADRMLERGANKAGNSSAPAISR